MKIACYGYRIIMFSLLVSVVISAGVVYMALEINTFLLLVLIFPVFFCGWVVWFFRDPDRQVPKEEGVFVSPADGVVLDVIHRDGDTPGGAGSVFISIFMSIFNVHVNRSPCDGRVVDVSYKSGCFFNAGGSRASERNEAVTTVLACTSGEKEYRITIRQVAGAIARRIINTLTRGRQVRRGERIGMIKFGSRLEITIPGELVGEVLVSPGRHVRAASTILARLPISGSDQ